jgi:glyoxylate reductase
MTRPRILVTSPMAEEGLALLRATCDVAVGTGDRKAVLDSIRDCDGLLVVGHTKVNPELLDAAPKLRMIANFGVGVDHIDVAAASARKIWVSNTAGSLTETTAELGWALILSTVRRVTEGDRLVRAGNWTGFGAFFFLGSELMGKTLGIIGAGRIGQAVARKASAFGMKTLLWSRAPQPDLDTVLRESDVVVLTVSLSAETTRLIGARELGLMKKTAYLVNIARGPVVDEAALATALLEGRIAGAGLDVYEKEPEVHPDLLRCSNAVLAPHIGSATVETRRRMALIAAQNLLEGLAGRVPPLALNPGAF